MSKENCKNLMIYATRFVNTKSRKMLNLHHHELMGKVQEHEGKKMIGIEKFGNTNILIDADDEFPDDN